MCDRDVTSGHVTGRRSGDARVFLLGEWTSDSPQHWIAIILPRPNGGKLLGWDGIELRYGFARLSGETDAPVSVPSARTQSRTAAVVFVSSALDTEQETAAVVFVSSALNTVPRT